MSGTDAGEALVFAVSPTDANRVRGMIKKHIEGPHFGIDGSYEEGVMDTIAWLLGEQDFIAYDGWLKKPRREKAQ